MPFNITFKSPFGMLISGPSQSGKTTWVYNLLKEKHKLIEPAPTTVLLFYEEYQPLYGRMLQEKLITKAIEGVPTYDIIKQTIKEYQEESSGHCLAIFDDASQSLQHLEPLFKVGSHHLKTSAIVLTQMLFGETSHLRVMTANCAYQVLLKTIRGQYQVRTLASQLSTSQASFIVNSYLSSTKTPYSYLVIDLKPEQSDVVRLRSRLFE